MPWYRTGAVAITAGQTTVTGTGTAFAVNGRVGDGFLGPDGRWYEVTNIASATVLSILPAYQGATVSGGSFALAPIQGYTKTLADSVNNLVNQWGSTLAGLGSVSTENVVTVAKGGTGSNNASNARVNLGLGTAATLTATTSSTDNTVGRAMKVGDFQLGVVAMGTNITDFLSDSNITGPIRGAFSSVGNGPNTNNEGFGGWCTKYTSSVAFYLVTGGTNKTWFGYKASGTTITWTELKDASDAVSASANQEISGIKTFVGTQVRYKGSTPGLWMEEPGTNNGIWMVLNGQILQFQHRLTGFGGTAGTTPLAMYTTLGVTRSGYQFTPATDNNAAMQLGASNYRWPVIYSATGAINTSDAREKTIVAKLSENEINAAKALAKEIGSYQWLQSVQEKGEDARLHIGMTVQRAIEIMESFELDPMAYGFICFDQWDAVAEVTQMERYGKLYSINEETGEKEYAPDDADAQEWQASPGTGVFWEYRREVTNVVTPATPAGDRYSFRYDELNLFIAAGFEARLAALEEATAAA